MLVYFVRHGQSMANVTNSISTPFIPLTDKGVEDAQRAGEMLKTVKFDKVYTSPYTRAMNTQKIALPEVDGEVVDCLHEVFCGKIEGLTYKNAEKEYGKSVDDAFEVDDFTVFGGEDYANVRKRVREFMDLVVKNGGEKVVAFSHAGFILTFFDEVMKREGKIDRNINCDNGSISIFRYKDGVWTVKAFNIIYPL